MEDTVVGVIRQRAESIALSVGRGQKTYNGWQKSAGLPALSERDSK